MKKLRQIPRWCYIVVALVAVTACAPRPGGPSRADLAGEPVFAAVMPGASELSGGGQDDQGGVEGATYSYATRILLSEDDKDTVVAWHRAAFEAAGWVAAPNSSIAMADGHYTDFAWRRGNLVLGLGFPRRNELSREYPAGTMYETTITYQPVATPRP